uniref:stabilizer of axonemal microtubules 2 n=1 Tax=Scatophagus argus TaxID=75038 RepID=UPI001ED7D7CB|nr:stabilizer of axonemal microtubules 2 [Scatophagus argus]
MLPKTMRRHSRRAQTPPSMSTEYQDKFLHPCCYKTVISTSTQKNPYHPLKATSNDVSTFKLCYVTHKRIHKNPPKASQPSVQPKRQQRCSSAPDNPAQSAASHTEPKEDAYMSVYQRDFQTWKVSKRQSHKLIDNLKVDQGLVVPLGGSKEGRAQKRSVQFAANSKAVPCVQNLKPFEGITSYRSDFVCHPVQPGACRKKPAHQPNKGLPLEPAVYVSSEMTRGTNQEPLDEASELFQEFMTLSLENKFQGQDKAKESSPPADHKVFSTTHADCMAQECKPTTPVLPSMQTREKSKMPFQTTTMKEDYKAWYTPRHLPTVSKEELDWPGKTSFSVHTPKPADRCKTSSKSLSLHPKLSEPAVSNSNSNTSEKPQYIAEDGVFSSFDSPPGLKNSGDTGPTLDRDVIWSHQRITESFAG